MHTAETLIVSTFSGTQAFNTMESTCPIESGCALVLRHGRRLFCSFVFLISLLSYCYSSQTTAISSQDPSHSTAF